MNGDCVGLLQGMPRTHCSGRDGSFPQTAPTAHLLTRLTLQVKHSWCQ